MSGDTDSRDDVAETKRPKGRYISLRDLAIIVIVILGVAIVVNPFYTIGVEERNRSFCKMNFRAIGQAIQSYAEVNSDMLPPTHVIAEDGGPQLENGLPLTWATQIQPYLNVRQNFDCPTAAPEEGLPVYGLDPKKPQFRLTYGMYRGVSSVPLNRIPNPDETIVVAETANAGANGSFDPMPFDGQPKMDGFLIGWDTDNYSFDKGTKWVTRLAFRGSANGYESSKVTARHDKVIHALTVSGGLRPLAASDARVTHLQPRLSGLWWADPVLFK